MIEFKELQGKSVIVTGAAGCIGAWAIKLLLEGGAHPVAYDLSDNRSRLQLIMDDAFSVTWEFGDISDYDQLLNVAKKYDAAAIIHLAALQVPFCKADPVGSTRVNVLGSINVLEAARQLGISRLSYASSIAAPAMGDNDYLATLYGAHKICGEQMAAVYWQDWQVPSVGIRPCVVYGPGRDQGMSAAPTIAMLAAFAGQPYRIPFTGPVTYVHAEDAALRFVTAVAQEQKEAPVFDLNADVVDTHDIVSMCQQWFETEEISASGGVLPFPAEPDDGLLDSFLGTAKARDFATGFADTISLFSEAQRRNVLNDGLVSQLIAKNL